MKLTTYTINPDNNALSFENERVIHAYDNYINPLAILEPVNLTRFMHIGMQNNVLKESYYKKTGELQEVTENTFVYDNNRVISARSVISEPGYNNPTTINASFFYN